MGSNLQTGAGAVRMQSLLGRLVFIFATLVVSPLWAAADLDRTVEFHIPAQPLDSALLEFSKQAQVPVAVNAGLLRSKKSPTVNGSLVASAALSELLVDSGLEYGTVGGTVTVAPISSGSSSNEPSSQDTAASPKSGGDGTRIGASSVYGVRHESDKTNSNQHVEEVLVTAQKREERLIDTPQSVTVLSADAISRLGAVQFRDFANTVPGLAFTTTGAGYSQLTLRGITAGADTSPTVGIYVDDVPYGSSSGLNLSSRLSLDTGLFDVGRIELLRGPQGTLYGASTMGGLIKYVTKQPNMNEVGGDAQAGVSSTHDGSVNWNVAAAVNAPLINDRAALRLSGFESRDGGFIDNLGLGANNVSRSDIYGGRVDLLLKVTDSLSIRLAGFLQNISRDGQASADFTLSGTPVDSALDQRRLYPEPFDQRFRLGSGTITYDFGPAALTSISSYQTVNTQMAFDVSRLYVPLLSLFQIGDYGAIGLPDEQNTDKFTQEIRLASHQSGPLEWLFGGFYTHETSLYAEEFAIRGLDGAVVPNNLYSLRSPTHYEEYAAFGDLTYHLSSKFDVSGGIRYAWNNQDSTQIGSGLLIGSTPTRRSSEHVATYLANARYHLNDNATSYIRYATGYRPGGPNFIANDPATGLPLGPSTFKADHLKSFEVGVKAETADRIYGVDLAAYYVDWTDIQVRATINGFGVIVNAPGGATVRGAELTLTAHPVDAFTMSGAFAYQDAHLSDADSDLGATKGERLPNVPRFTAALNADYRLEGAFEPTVGATLRSVTDRTAGFNNNPNVPQYQLPGYMVLDLRGGISLGAVNIQLYVHNVADKRAELSAFTNYSTAGGAAEVAISQPRTVGLTATAHF